jgi:hypothetical protein
MVFFFNIALADHGEVYLWLMCAQIFFYTAAFCGGVFRNAENGWRAIVKNVCYAPYVFCLLNFSAFIAFFRFVMQDQSVMWAKARQEGEK